MELWGHPLSPYGAGCFICFPHYCTPTFQQSWNAGKIAEILNAQINWSKLEPRHIEPIRWTRREGVPFPHLSLFVTVSHGIFFILSRCELFSANVSHENGKGFVEMVCSLFVKKKSFFNLDSDCRFYRCIFEKTMARAGSIKRDHFNYISIWDKATFFLVEMGH